MSATDPPARFPEGTAPGNTTVIGARCVVTYAEAMPDKARTVVLVTRVGRLAHVYPGGQVAVRLPWGEMVTADAAQVEVIS